jgi:hypothetical protein
VRLNNERGNHGCVVRDTDEGRPWEDSKGVAVLGVWDMLGNLKKRRPRRVIVRSHVS